jgi:hypothetical protein
MTHKSSSRRDAIRLAGGAAMATTFLPATGKFRTWAHPAANNLVTRPLGRTGREVTTFGLAGGNKVMWDLPGQEGVEIVVKAVRAGITYLETANNYQLSQLNYNKAFRILNLIPGQPGYAPRFGDACFWRRKPACVMRWCGMVRDRWGARPAAAPPV